MFGACPWSAQSQKKPFLAILSLVVLITAGPADGLASEAESLEEAEARYAAGRFIEAASRYIEVGETATDRATLARCLIRLGDCWWRGDWWPPHATPENFDFSPDQYYALAIELGYSPYLVEVFEKWQTVYQAWWHGVSNFSAIPHATYAARRQAVLERIADHLKVHPGDEEALAQKAELERVPGIESGGPMGSTALNHMGTWWPELLRDTAD